ncbi:hypothetical protein Tco_0981300 [Tanacetum coccineum]
MENLKFADTHNLVAFLSKPAESEGFEQIVDFLNANPIKYALTINPTIYISCIEQFWSTVKAKTINGEVQLHALVDGKKIIITESSVRRDLQLEDAEDEACHKELGDVYSEWRNYCSSFEAEQDMSSGPDGARNMGDTIAQNVFENVSKLSNDSLFEKEDLRKLEKKEVQELIADKIIQNEDITLVNEMFDVNALNGEDGVFCRENRNVLLRNVVDDLIQIAKQQEQEEVGGRKRKESRRRADSREFKEAKGEDNKEIVELKQCMEIIPGEEEVTIDAIHLAVKSQDFDGRIHKEKERKMQHVHIHMLVEKKYPLIPSTLSMMLEKKLQIDYESEMAYQLLKFIVKQLKK